MRKRRKRTNTDKILQNFLDEDIGKGDITSELLFPPNKKITAHIISRQKGVVAGIDYAKKIFALEGSKSNIKKEDGSVVLGGQTIMTVSGNARQILACERTALNLLSRMSGIATQTRKIAKKISRYKAKLYATRKTAPGLRIFDKEAVKIGGGEKHRLGLDDMIMIKDNHIAAAGGSIVELIRKAKRKGYKEIEVEVENQSNAVVAAKEGATIIMLDNFTPLQIKKTILKLRKERLREKVKVEASGGINENTIKEYAAAGVDIISLGMLTHSVKGLDFSLEVS